MSLAEYRTRLPHHFKTEDTPALDPKDTPALDPKDTPASDPGASKEKVAQREQRSPTLEARIKEKRVHYERSSSSSSSKTSNSGTDTSTVSKGVVIRVQRPPDVGSIEKRGNTSKTSKRPSKGFVDIVEYHYPYWIQLPPKFFLTEEFVQLKKASGGARPPGGNDRWNFGDYAVILRRTCRDHRTTGRSLLVRTDLEIYSEPLCIRFREIAAKSYKNTNLEGFPIVLKSPFYEPFYYRAEIKALANDENIDTDLRRDAQALDEFVHLPNGPLTPIIEAYEGFEKEGKIFSDFVWTIYPPSSLLVYDTGSIKECYICRNVAQHSTNTGEQEWVVTGLRIGFDGNSPVLVRQTFTLHSQGSELIEIAKLPLQPFHVYSAWEVLEPLLKKRSESITTGLGTNFRSFACHDYSGSAWGGYDTDLSNEESPTRIKTERVIVDATQFPYRSLHFPSTNVENINIDSSKTRLRKPKPRRVDQMPASSSRRHTRRPVSPIPREGVLRRQRSWDSERSDSEFESSLEDFLTTTTYDATDNTSRTSSPRKPDHRTIDGLAEASVSLFHITAREFGLLFPALVPAFGLSSRKWWWVLSDRLQDVEWNNAAFDFLQHNQDTKHLVQNLIKAHKCMSAASDDVIAGQGQGLAFLLHGNSGLGKRYTAETIAEYLERPLYSVSIPGLINDFGALEGRLDRFFHQAERWNAVALLEEADVLFGKSDSGDLVTKITNRAFVRELENFQGVLIFKTTTNKDLNEDIKSLIDLTIRYPALSSDAQARIWENLIKGNKTTTDQSWNEAVYGELGKLCLNGRTIKNVLRTAVAFADGEEKPLGARHVLAILGTELSTEDFENDEGKWEKQVQPALHKLHEMLGIPFQQG